MRYISRAEFQAIVDRYEGDKGVRTLDCWTWLGGLSFGQLTGHCSVRAISKAFQVYREGLATLGFNQIQRSTFADANEKRPVEILEEVFYRLLDKTQLLAPRSKFKFKGKVADIKAVRRRYFAPGTTLVVDRGYADYGWFNDLNEKGVFFVTRMKSNVIYAIKGRRRTNRTRGVICDQTIELTSQKGKRYRGVLRKVSYRDKDTQKRLTFLTNRFDLSPKTIADLYKARWEVELFFKTLKGQLRITKLIGTSENSVRAQIWAALVVYLLIALIRFSARIGWSTPETMAVIGVMLFVRQDLMDLLKDAPLQRVRSPVDQQLSFF
jgi:putative transposase